MKKLRGFLRKSIVAILVLANMSTPVTFAQSNSDKNVQAPKDALINTILTSKDPEAVEKANNSLNQIIEDEVKQNTINTTNTTNAIQPRVGVQIRNYTSSTVSNYMDRKGSYGAAYTTGTSESKTVSVSITAGTQFKTTSGTTISLGTSVSGSATSVITGPAYNTKLPGSALTATHSVAISILRGTIVHETYDYYDGSTGAFISHVDQYVIGGSTVTRYNLLVSNTATTYYVGHCTNQTYKSYSSEQAFKDVINSTNPTPAYSW